MTIIYNSDRLIHLDYALQALDKAIIKDQIFSNDIDNKLQDIYNQLNDIYAIIWQK